jgi:hypothetical protein
MEHFANAYVRVEMELGLHVVRVTRSEMQFSTDAEIERTFAETSSVLDRIGRNRWALLIDLRRVRGNPEPRLDAAIRRATAPLIAGFPRVAVIVTSAAGALQMKRHLRDEGPSREVFQDEAAALAFLSEWWLAARART